MIHAFAAREPRQENTQLDFQGIPPDRLLCACSAREALRQGEEWAQTLRRDMPGLSVDALLREA